MMESPALQINGLTKRHGQHMTLDQVNLTLPRGVIYGLVGPNGSGKTTAIRIAAGLDKPTAGIVTILGHEQPAGRAEVTGRFSALIERPAYYGYLPAVDNLYVLGRTSDIAESLLRGRIPHLLRDVGLSESTARRPMREFAEGERQRWGWAATLLSDPELLLLDEPTNGLDPPSRLELLEKLLILRDQGKSILFTSHLFDEVKRVCSHLYVMNRGQVVWHGPIDRLPKAYLDTLFSDRVRHAG
jgi:ABC-2 type transport system ATP-binding protein